MRRNANDPRIPRRPRHCNRRLCLSCGDAMTDMTDLIDRVNESAKRTGYISGICECMKIVDAARKTDPENPTLAFLILTMGKLAEDAPSPAKQDAA